MLTTLIYWLRWLRWYIEDADYADIQLYMKNIFIIDYTDYAVMKDYYWQNIRQFLHWYWRVIAITVYVDYLDLNITIKTVSILHASHASNFSLIWQTFCSFFLNIVKRREQKHKIVQISIVLIIFLTDCLKIFQQF